MVGATAGCVTAPEGYFRAVREICDPGDPSDRHASADVMHMTEEQLSTYFAEDADYHPINGYKTFESSPLVRRRRSTRAATRGELA